ncbi:hypothetical protein GCM10010332_02090 [Streptomyces albogriseolus]|nr:hypothetical protein GCM10010332_02090 [Streptomyces albogriseolus]
MVREAWTRRQRTDRRRSAAPQPGRGPPFEVPDAVVDAVPCRAQEAPVLRVA